MRSRSQGPELRAQLGGPRATPSRSSPGSPSSSRTGPPVEVELIEETKHARQTAEATVFAKGQTLRATESTSDMRASIDRLVESLERQVVPTARSAASSRAAAPSTTAL